MRVPRFRFTMRWLLVAVAIVALVCGAEALRRRRSIYRREQSAWSRLKNWAARDVERYDRWEEQSLRGMREMQALYERFRELDGARRARDESRRQSEEAAEYHGRAVRERALIQYYSRMEAKYERAARYPWLPVTPDPPDPPH